MAGVVRSVPVYRRPWTAPTTGWCMWRRTCCFPARWRLRWIILVRAGVKVAAPVAHPWQWLETALWFTDVGYVRDAELVARYDWENVTPTDFPEVRLERLIEGDVFALPFRGYRNDLGAVTAQNMRKFFPTGIDWITHADPAVCREFLRVNGHG